MRPRSIDEAYAIQDRLHEHHLADGHGPLVGWKIALTSPLMQRLVGIDQPCAGAILANRTHHETATLAHADFASLGVESEIAVAMARDLTAEDAPYDRQSVGDAVATCMAAIEIVDTRNAEADVAKVDAGLLIADNAMNAGCVLGSPVADWRGLDLATLAGRMIINGEIVGQGIGGDALGHPLQALAWLANNLAGRGQMLKAGDIVLTGSIVATKWLNPGDEMATVIDGLGQAEVRVS